MVAHGYLKEMLIKGWMLFEITGAYQNIANFC